MALQNVTKIGIGWIVVTVLGISGFVYSKRNIDKKRYQNMKARERIRNATLTD